jgi:hypothetical protein
MMKSLAFDDVLARDGHELGEWMGQGMDESSEMSRSPQSRIVEFLYFCWRFLLAKIRDIGQARSQGQTRETNVHTKRPAHLGRYGKPYPLS